MLTRRIRERARGLGTRSAEQTLARIGRASRSVARRFEGVVGHAQRRLPTQDGIELIRNVAYRRTGRAEHRLDIYRPAGARQPLPVVLYVHGGGFALLSKSTHGIMAQSYARRGFLVLSINYRLAPEHPYPAAIEDTAAAYAWLLDNASRYGGDLSRLVLAGESAGANLVTALTLMTCQERPEPWARAIYERGRVPDVVVPACGIFQVSEVERLWERRRMPGYVSLILQGVSAAYLRGQRDNIDLADPLLVLESQQELQRPLPPFFIPVGTRDPLLDDTRRLARALKARGATAKARYYTGEIHAFHATLVSPNARECWAETAAFIGRHLQPRAAVPEARFGRGQRVAEPLRLRQRG